MASNRGHTGQAVPSQCETRLVGAAYFLHEIGEQSFRFRVTAVVDERRPQILQGIDRIGMLRPENAELSLEGLAAKNFRLSIVPLLRQNSGEKGLGGQGR